MVAKSVSTRKKIAFTITEEFLVWISSSNVQFSISSSTPDVIFLSKKQEYRKTKLQSFFIFFF